MAKKKQTPLEAKFGELPKWVTFDKDIKPLLVEAGISDRTFHRDRKANPNSIPHKRLHVYAGMFGCDVNDLIDSFVKVKPIVSRRKIGSKVGLKTKS